jgi:hypothetical protein
MHPLDKVRLKLDRAKEHLAALDSEVADFLKLEPYRVEPKIDAENIYGKFGRFRIVHEPPIRFGLIFGDYIHNVRSALDHLVWQLQLKTTSTPKPRSQFPIFKQPNAGRLKDQTPDVSDEARGVIESLQPYNRTNRHGPIALHPLWQIGQLDGIDKHATPLVTVIREAVVIEDAMSQAFPPGSRLRTVNMLRNPLNDGDPVPLVTTPVRSLDDQTQIYVEPTYGIVLDEAIGLAVPLSELGRLHKVVDDAILPKFTRFFE